MTTSNELRVTEQRQVAFYEDKLVAVRASDGRVYTAISQMCEALGLDAQAQRRRMERHMILSAGVQGVANLATPGGEQHAYVLRADLVPLWLSGVRVSAVREELREKLARFQQEAAAVLWEAFQEGRLTADAGLSELLAGDSDAAQAYQLAVAIMKLARSHVALEGKVGTLEGRLEAVEDLLAAPERFVTQDQASQLSQAVKTVAMKLSKASGRNEYGGVYGELYRKFGITSYKQLPAAKFDEAMRWLNEWRASIDDNTPF